MKKIFLKHKKLLARIGSILACLLLVGALGLPSFALSADSTYREVLDQYVTDLGVSNPSYFNLIDAIVDNSSLSEDQAVSNLGYLRTGRFDTDRDYYVPVSFASNLDQDYDGNLDLKTHVYTMVIEDVQFSVQYGDADTGSIPYVTTSLSADITLELQDNTDVGGAVQASLSFADSSAGNLLAAVICSGQRANYSIAGEVIPEVVLYSLRVDGLVQADGTYLTVDQIIESDVPVYWSFAFRTVYNAMNDISSIVLGDDFVPVISPRSLLFGWVYGSNEGGGASQEELDVAYDLGFDAGFEAGFADDLIGDTFSAPFNALSRFTLFQWEDPAGNVHVITLMGVIGAGIGISLFIWFLKLFAGG